MAVWDTKISKSDGGFYGTPGYQNPLGKDGPSWGGSFDWKGGSKGIDWESGFGIDKSGLFESLFDKSRKTDKYKSRAERNTDPWGSGAGVRFGEATQGRGTQLLENLSALYPQQHAPMFIPGQQGEPSLGEKIARSAIGGVVGFATGGPVGALAGGSSPWFS